jgi:hypothetical protein
MGRKSPIRRLSSELPLSIEHSRALQLDGASIDYAQVAEASDSEIVDLDPSHWQYDDEDEDETGPEVNGQPAGDDAPARIEQSAEQPIKTVEQREPEKEPVKAAAARRSGQGSGQTAGLFQD